MYYRLLACLMALSMTQATYLPLAGNETGNTPVAERGGGEREMAPHTQSHESHPNENINHANYNRGGEDFHRDAADYNEVNRNDFNGVDAAGWGAGAAVPAGEYVYPTAVPVNDDMNTLYNSQGGSSNGN